MKKPTRVERKRRRRRIFFRLILLLLLVTFATAYAFKSDFLKIDNINIKGNSIIEDATIISASRINLGENILSIKKSNVKHELELLPYIKTATIKQKLPDTINISVEEREPILQIRSISSYILTDIEGISLEITDNKLENLPIFVGFNIENIELGSDILINNIDAGLEDFFNDEEIIPVLNKMEKIEYNTEEINIDLNNGISVAFGPLDNVKYKLRYLDKILIDIEKKQLDAKMIIMNKGENPIIVTDN